LKADINYVTILGQKLWHATANTIITGKPHMYDFFKEHREELTSFILNSNLTSLSKEYSKFREDYMSFSEKFLKVITDLFQDWQRKYYLIETELEDESNRNW
jgi:hypothetical protein